MHVDTNRPACGPLMRYSEILRHAQPSATAKPTIKPDDQGAAAKPVVQNHQVQRVAGQVTARRQTDR
jgi:hypothetical protein